MSNLFANVAEDGTLVAQSGVVSITRGVPGYPKVYVLKLNRSVNVLRTHIDPVCRPSTFAPASRISTAMIDSTHAAVHFFGSDTLACDMAFTVTIEEF